MKENEIHEEENEKLLRKKMGGCEGKWEGVEENGKELKRMETCWKKMGSMRKKMGNVKESGKVQQNMGRRGRKWELRKKTGNIKESGKVLKENGMREEENGK